MSQQSFLKFLTAARDDIALLTRYNQRDLSQLIFHAGNEGFDFTAQELAEVVGKLEANVILRKDRDSFDCTSRLWLAMWGRYHLEYLVNHVVRRHTDEELCSLLEQRVAEGQ
ncbi:MAG TPA: Nif11-like leader peptide family natural product precursor [Ktedonobacteraceae bacterium]